MRCGFRHMAIWACAVLLCALQQAHARQLIDAASGRSLACVDTYPACPGWAGQCSVPGVSTYCPCMCGVTPTPSPAAPAVSSPSPAPLPPSSPVAPAPAPSPSSGCVDTYPACPGWVGQCSVPGVATYCPCMCGVAPTTSPAPAPVPSTSPPPAPAPTPSPAPAPTPSPAPALAPTPSPIPPLSPAPAGPFVFSPYKDVTVNMNWNTNVMSTAVTGSLQPVLSILPATDQALTWAFATGECGAESWAGITPSALVSATVQPFVNAGKKYIISTGGAAGVFTCGTDAGFSKFLTTYMSSSMVGVDFDIEGGQSQADINNLVQRIAVARAQYPNLRWSFTLATLGSTSTGNQLNQLGMWVLQALKAANVGWNNIFINLMVMDYGSTSTSVCTVVNNQCDMGQSAINAAKALNIYWGVPFSSIELTPMIGGNDSPGETFTLANADAVSTFVKANGLGGVHFWSLDRDHDCAPGTASATCNTYGVAGTLGFTNRFITGLGL